MKRPTTKKIAHVKSAVFQEKDQMRLLMGSLIIAVWLVIAVMVAFFGLVFWAMIR